VPCRDPLVGVLVPQGLELEPARVEPDSPPPRKQHPAVAAHEVRHGGAIEGEAVQPEATVERVPQPVLAARELAPDNPPGYWQATWPSPVAAPTGEAFPMKR